MDRLEAVSRWLQQEGFHCSLRLGPCGQWKIRLYTEAGRKVYETLAPTMPRAFALALREVERARSARVAA